MIVWLSKLPIYHNEYSDGEALVVWNTFQKVSLLNPSIKWAHFYTIINWDYAAIDLPIKAAKTTLFHSPVHVEHEANGPTTTLI